MIVGTSLGIARLQFPDDYADYLSGASDRTNGITVSYMDNKYLWDLANPEERQTAARNMLFLFAVAGRLAEAALDSFRALLPSVPLAGGAFSAAVGGRRRSTRAQAKLKRKYQDDDDEEYEPDEEWELQSPRKKNGIETLLLFLTRLIKEYSPSSS